MKIQELAIIFIIIILPISIVLSVYTQYQVQAINTQTQYDQKLTSATYDAIRAFQINTEDDTGSDMENSKLESLSASIKTFKNSLLSSFELKGYKEEDMNSYIPALVYTLYDGFYIYSPYENTNYRYEEKKDKDGKTLIDEDGNIQYNEDKLIDGNGEKIYGLKPYISYSCRYVKGNIDVVITYALDNYITVQGKIGNEYVNKSGYLIDNIETIGNTVKYNGVEIEQEHITEYIGGLDAEYPYVKINGVKYYYIKEIKQIAYFENDGTLKTQCTQENPEQFHRWVGLIEGNFMAQDYYKDAKDFTSWFSSKLGSLQYSDAVEETEIDKDGNKQLKKIWETDNRKIFEFNTSRDYTKNIENESSNFNQHRLEIIRNKIEKNLAIAISNYNEYLGTGSTDEFQMPELKEDEWDYITHNISMISFLQGLKIGERTYNGYTVVTNTESKEVVLEQYIYILGKDNTYHRIGDKYLEGANRISTAYNNNTGSTSSGGRLHLDFNRKKITASKQTYYYFALKKFNASYDSVVMQDNVTTYDDIYEYVSKQNNDLKKAFYTALGRERYSKYKILSYVNINQVTKDLEVHTISYDGNGGECDIEAQVKFNGIDKKLSEKKLEKEDSIFQGWSTIQNGTEVEYNPGDIYKENKSVILYAVWKKKTYTISYDLNQGQGTQPPIQTKEWGEEKLITSTVPTREGYTFIGWRCNADGQLYEYTGRNNKYKINANAVMTAEWKLNIYKITYHGNGGLYNGSTTWSEDVAYGTSYKTYGNFFNRTGYTFIGWNERADGSGVDWTSYINRPWTWTYTRDVTLYAQWRPNKYKVTYHGNGGLYNGSTTWSEDVTYGTNYTTYGNFFSRGGYTFVGWNERADGSGVDWTSYINRPWTWTYTRDVTLYAIWKPNKPPKKVYNFTIHGYGNTIHGGGESWPNAVKEESERKAITTIDLTNYTTMTMYIGDFKTDYKELMPATGNKGSNARIYIGGNLVFDENTKSGSSTNVSKTIDISGYKGEYTIYRCYYNMNGYCKADGCIMTLE